MRTLKSIAIGLVGVLALTSCKKEFSPDDPLIKELTPSLYVVNNNNIVLSLDPLTGEKKWETKINNNVSATPVIVSNCLLLVDISGMVYKLNRLTGKVERTYPLGSTAIGSPLVLDDRRVAIPSGNDIKTFDIANDFELLWQFGAGTPITTSLATNKFPNQDTSRIYFVSDTSVYALNANNGLLTWKRPVTGAKKFNSSICAPDRNFLYAGNDNGKLYAFNSIDGSTKFSYQTDAEIHSSPISVGGNVMVGSNDRTFYSVDSATGLLRWKMATGDRILSSPYVYNQNVYFGSNDFQLYNINIIDGTLRWKNLTFGTIVTSPLVYNDIVYYNGHDQNVYAVDSKTGKAIWTYNTNGYMTSSMLLDNVNSWVVPSISGNSKY